MVRAVGVCEHIDNVPTLVDQMSGQVDVASNLERFQDMVENYVELLKRAVHDLVPLMVLVVLVSPRYRFLNLRLTMVFVMSRCLRT